MPSGEATIMNRQCSRCQRTFTRDDFVKEESRNLEADRKEARLDGVHFFDYRCPACGNEDVFVDVVRLDGESAEEFEARKAELEATAGRLRAERLKVVVVERDRMSE
jgi:CRISPR/Cas system-associated protein Cas10 (large subunit of type III CRISPR-Cas system)